MLANPKPKAPCSSPTNMYLLTRIIPQRLLRAFIIILLTSGVIAAVAVLVGAIYILLHLPADLSGLPPWFTKGILPNVKILVLVLGAVGFAFVCLILFFEVNFIRADKVKAWFVEFQISEELTRTQTDLEAQVELVAGLQENIREIQDLIEQQSLVFVNPDVNKYFDYLDKIVETAAFVIRPQIRSVRASIWLYNKSIDKMRIVAGYRIRHSTLRRFEMKREDRGFAPHVIRSGGPEEKVGPSAGQDWQIDPESTTPTTSILGQPIKVGLDEAWEAVLCFSTDRDIGKF